MAEIRNIISADTGPLKSGLAEAKGSVENYSSGVSASMLTAAAGFVSAGLAISKSFEAMKHFETIGDLSQRFDLATDSVQRFGQVFDQNGSNVEGFVMAMQKLKKATGDALKGVEPAQQVFAAAGISLDDLRNGAYSTEEMLYKLADAIANTASDADKMNAAIAIFGDDMAAKMLPILNQGGEGLRKMAAEASALDGEMVSALQAASAEWKAFMALLEKVWGTLATGAVRAVSFVRFVGDAIGILAAHIADMDFSGMGKDFEDAMVRAADRAYGKINNMKKGAGGAIIEDPKAKASAEKESDDLDAKRKTLADLKAKADLDAMERQQRINALMEEYGALMSKSVMLGMNTKEGLDAQIEAEKKLADAKREQKAADDEAKRAADAAAKQAADVAKAEANADEKNRTLGMSKSEKLDDLIGRQRRLFAEAGAEKDPTKAAELRTKAKDLTPEIFGLSKELSKPTAPTVSSLQAIGLGGGIAAPNDRQLAVAEQSRDILREISNKLGGDSNASAAID